MKFDYEQPSRSVCLMSSPCVRRSRQSDGEVRLRDSAMSRSVLRSHRPHPGDRLLRRRGAQSSTRLESERESKRNAREVPTYAIPLQHQPTALRLRVSEKVAKAAATGSRNFEVCCHRGVSCATRRVCHLDPAAFVSVEDLNRDLTEELRRPNTLAHSSTSVARPCTS